MASYISILYSKDWRPKRSMYVCQSELFFIRLVTLRTMYFFVVEDVLYKVQYSRHY